MAKLEERRDDVLVQGDTYEEDDDVDILDSEAPASQREDKKRSPVIIALVCVGIIVVLVLLVVGGSKVAKTVMKPTESETAYETEPFAYLDVEKSQLREHGFTGSEIESAEAAEIEAGALIREAEEKRKAQLDSELAPYLDGKSEEYKTLEEFTWLGGAEFTFDPETVSTWQHKGAVKNLDYEKVPLRGYQCFLKVQMSKGNPETGSKPTYAFMTVSPQRYAELAQDGNINVDIDYYFIAETSTTIIIDMTEKRVTDN